MTETEERLRLVADVVKADLEERFAGKVAFDPIVVAPARSVYGDDYFRVIVVVPDGAVLEPRQLNKSNSRVWDTLYEMGMTEYPNISFVAHSDWLDPDRYNGGKRGVYLERY